MKILISDVCSSHCMRFIRILFTKIHVICRLIKYIKTRNISLKCTLTKSCLLLFWDCKRRNIMNARDTHALLNKSVLQLLLKFENN